MGKEEKMEAIYRQFFTTMSQFHKLRISELLPDMTKVDFMTLMEISHLNCGEEKKKVTTSVLAEKMQAKPSAISRTLKGLEEKGLIERSVNRADRRNTYVELTEQGKQVIKDCKSDLDEVMLAVYAKMEPEDIRRLIGYLNEIYLIAKEEIELRIKKKRKETGR